MQQPILLEPLSTGDVIDRSVRSYRRNVRPLLATAAGPFVFGAIASLCINIGMKGLTPGKDMGLSPIGSLVLLFTGIGSYVLYLYIMILVVAGLARAVGDHLLL